MKTFQGRKLQKEPLYHKKKTKKEGRSPRSYLFIQEGQNMVETRKCKILTFRKKDDRASLFIECCPSNEVDDRVAELTGKGLVEIPSSRSRDLEIRESQKINIILKGAITYIKEINRAYHCITYLTCCRHNYTSFPVRLVKEAGTVAHAIIEYESLNFGREILHQVHYTPERHHGSRVHFVPDTPRDTY
ncbi:hypothetical protein CHS0354_017787 [Potamilus streckersoni]|uniref:Uncharacterized protein n=1 Tax=Potamilus streckersoni TaxID=2493646 RepID=A0AAE0W900_9BIVA|nr:hypothetical protein CHS0354_017787 [Potamilus streckersoni]